MKMEDTDNDHTSTSSSSDDIKTILETIKSEISTQNQSESNVTSDNDELFNVDVLKQVFSTDSNNIEAEDTELFTDIIAFLNNTKSKENNVNKSSLSTKSLINDVHNINNCTQNFENNESFSDKLQYNSYDDNESKPVTVEQPKLNIQQTTIIDDSNVEKKQKYLKKQFKQLNQNTLIDDYDDTLSSNPISLSSTSSLLLRNKYEYAPEYQPYEHNSIQKELKQRQKQEQSKPVPIYSTKSVNSDIIKTVTNTLCDLKVISESLHLSSDIENQIKKICHNDEDHITNHINFNQCQCIFKEYQNVHQQNDIKQQMSTKSSSLISSQHNDNQHDKKQYLKDITKNLVDSETYFQKCLTELYNCAAKVVAHKNDYNTTATQQQSETEKLLTSYDVDNVINDDQEDKKCVIFNENDSPTISNNNNNNNNIRQYEPVGNSSTLTDTLSEAKVKEIEKSMKELDKNRILCSDIKLNREYKDDLISLIEKLKFLASYKKKVALRPKRKEKKEFIDKLKKNEEILSNNNFEEVVTQMEFDSSSFITSNQQQSQSLDLQQHEYRHEIKNSVEKVVEWKRITNKYINTDISAEIKFKKHHENSDANMITYSEQPIINDKKKDKLNKDKEKKKERKKNTQKSSELEQNKKRNLSNRSDKQYKIKTRKDDLSLMNKRDDNKNFQIPSSRSTKIIDKFNKDTNDSSIQNMKPLKMNLKKTKMRLDDDETRLLNQITPTAVAPFSAEYSKQKRIKQKKTIDDKILNDDDNVSVHKNETSHEDEKKHINLSDVQYLQNLITDPNARFKSTMTIMPVTVKNYYKTNNNKFIKKDIAEKPFEQLQKKKVNNNINNINNNNVNNNIIDVQSPVRCYIRSGSVNNRTLYTENDTKYIENKIMENDDKYKEKPEKPLEKATNEKKSLYTNNTYTNLINTTKNIHDICVNENEHDKKLTTNDIIKQSNTKLNSKLETQKRNTFIKDQLKLENKPRKFNLSENERYAITKVLNLKKIALNKSNIIENNKQKFKQENNCGIPLTRRFESLAMPKKYYIQAQCQEYKHRLGPQFENRMSTIINKNNKLPKTNLVNVLNKLDEIIDGDNNNIPYNKKDKSIIRIPSPIEEENMCKKTISEKISSSCITETITTNNSSINIIESNEKDVQEIFKKSNVDNDDDSEQHLIEDNSSSASKLSVPNGKNNSTISTTIVTCILKNLIQSVIQHEPLSSNKLSENSLENFRNLLYENCSSSTLFKKLDEILSFDSFSNWTMNSDTTISSLLSSIDDISNVIIRHQYLLFGIQHKIYFTRVVYNTKVHYLSTILYSIKYEDCVTQHPLELMGFINHVTLSVCTLPMPYLTQNKHNKVIDILETPIVYYHCEIVYFRTVVSFSTVLFLPLVYDISIFSGTTVLVENIKPLVGKSRKKIDYEDEFTVLKSKDKISIKSTVSISETMNIAYKDMSLLVLYSLLFVCVFSCLVVHPVCL